MSSAGPAPRRAATVAALRAALGFFASLRLTVALLALGLLLIFAGTLEQVTLGIWAVQEKYFRSFVIYAAAGPLTLPVFPGGYTLGPLLLLNLVAAHAVRCELRWRRLGLALTHGGLVLLLVGELFSGLWQRDFHLRLNPGETKRFAESLRQYELAFTATGDPAHDTVVSVPQARLARGAGLAHAALPFRAIVRDYFPNSALQPRAAPAVGAGFAPGDIGERLAAVPLPFTPRPGERNLPSALVELFGPAGSLGMRLVSAHLPVASHLVHDGRPWQIALRPERAYLPAALTLRELRHDRYAGTEIPRNFSSRLWLETPGAADGREVLIAMNEPLRFGGYAFYQAGVENNDRTTVLQIVRNPAWTVPYVACALMTLGLVWHFGLHLAGFVGRRTRAGQPSPGAATPLWRSDTTSAGEAGDAARFSEGSGATLGRAGVGEPAKRSAGPEVPPLPWKRP